MAQLDWIIEDADVPETWGQQFGRIGTGAGIKALEGLENIGSLIKKGTLPFTGELLPEFSPSGYLKERLGLTPEYLQPRGFLESAVQRGAESIPLAAATGGMPGALSSAFGSAAGAGLSQLGAPEWLQDIGQLGTEIALGYPHEIKTPSGKTITKRVSEAIPGVGKKIGKIPGIHETKKAAYESLKKLSPKGMPKTEARPIVNAIDEVYNALGTEVSRPVHKKIQFTLGQLGENIAANKINPHKAFELRKKLNAFSRELNPAQAAEYIEPLRKGIEGFFAEYAAENPEFYKNLNTGDRLTSLRDMNTYVTDFMKSIPVAGKLARLPGISSALEHGEKLIKGLSHSPQARKYYFDAVSAVAKNDPVSFSKNFERTLDFIPFFRKEKSKMPQKEMEWLIE